VCVERIGIKDRRKSVRTRLLDRNDGAARRFEAEARTRMSTFQHSELPEHEILQNKIPTGYGRGGSGLRSRGAG
jgi:hypothetical protein